MIALMVQKYEQIGLPTGEMILDSSQEAASQGEDTQLQTAESQVGSECSDGTEVWTDSSAKW